MKLLAAFLLCSVFALPAGDPPGFFLWKSSALKAYSQSLAPKLNGKKIASEALGDAGSYRFQVTLRAGSGEGEWHEKKADIFVVQSGEATLVYGGELVDPRKTAAGEMMAPSIRGGMEKKLAAGDVVTIPARCPHQLKLDPGKDFTYFVVKVDQ